MEISVVIPTCERKTRLLSLLHNLNESTHPIAEVIIVDSGNDKLLKEEYAVYTSLSVRYVESERSVCIQRNTGIKIARSPWIFLCDDDIEIPKDYLQILVNHVVTHQEAGALSGLWMEKQKDEWRVTHPVGSTRELLWKYIFQLGIWGEIKTKDRLITRNIRRYYEQKGNHISKAGWPVNTDFAGEYAICPVYSLGASLVKKEWLMASPFDELLDRHGIGDHYGVSIGFPVAGVRVVGSTVVYHHLEPANRLKRSLQYYRRVLALDYFIRTKKTLKGVKRGWLVWSLFGNMISFILAANGTMMRANFKSIRNVMTGRNPYYEQKGNHISKAGWPVSG